MNQLIYPIFEFLIRYYLLPLLYSTKLHYPFKQQHIVESPALSTQRFT